MKKILIFVICICMAFSLVSCGGALSNLTDQITSPEAKKEAFLKFRKSVNSQNAVALNADVIVEADGEYMLVADVQNNTSFDLTEIVIAFAAFDSTGLPLYLDYDSETSESYYVVETDMEGLVIGAGERWYADMGLEVSYTLSGEKIDYVEAIVMEYKTASGTEWTNSDYEKWGGYFNGEALEDYMRVPEPTEAELKQEFDSFKTNMAAQNAVALEAGMYPQTDGRLMLMSDIKNNTAYELSAITIAFAAWDAEGNPVKMKGTQDTEGYYVQEISMGTLTVAAGEHWVSDLGFVLTDECKVIDHVEAIVISCTANGSVWENPYYGQWTHYFNGGKLETWMNTAAADETTAETTAEIAA